MKVPDISYLRPPAGFSSYLRSSNGRSLYRPEPSSEDYSQSIIGPRQKNEKFQGWEKAKMIDILSARLLIPYTPTVSSGDSAVNSELTERVDSKSLDEFLLERSNCEPSSSASNSGGSVDCLVFLQAAAEIYIDIDSDDGRLNFRKPQLLIRKYLIKVQSVVAQFFNKSSSYQRFS